MCRHWSWRVGKILPFCLLINEHLKTKEDKLSEDLFLELTGVAGMI